MYGDKADVQDQITGLANDGATGLGQVAAFEGRANVTVPHRANRMVLFDSSLYHRTDALHFRRGRSYTDRRINLTLLFGTPPAAQP